MSFSYLSLFGLAVSLFVGEIQKIECGSVLSVLLSTTIFVITLVKMLWIHEEPSNESYRFLSLIIYCPLKGLLTGKWPITPELIPGFRKMK